MPIITHHERKAGDMPIITHHERKAGEMPIIAHHERKPEKCQLSLTMKENRRNANYRSP